MQTPEPLLQAATTQAFAGLFVLGLIVLGAELARQWWRAGEWRRVARRMDADAQRLR